MTYFSRHACIRQTDRQTNALARGQFRKQATSIYTVMYINLLKFLWHYLSKQDDFRQMLFLQDNYLYTKPMVQTILFSCRTYYREDK